jgi:hypothetical protein
MTLIDKIRRARKAVVSTLTGLTTFVVMLAPDAGDEYKIIVGAVGVLFTGVITYFTPNDE